MGNVITVDEQDKVQIDLKALIGMSKDYLADFKLKNENDKGDITDIKVQFNAPSSAVKSRLDLIEVEYLERLNDLDLEYKEFKTKYEAYKNDAGGDEETLAKLINNDPEMLLTSKRKEAKVNAIRNIFTIKRFIAIVKTKGMLTEQRALFDTDASGDFWQSQTPAQLTEAYDFFMLLYRATTR